MTKRGEKQESTSRRKWFLHVLLDRGVLVPGDVVVFDEEQVPDGIERGWNPEDEFWRARIMGETGQQDNVEWLHDGNTYSFTGLTKELLHRLVDRDRDKTLNGYTYWCHPKFDHRTLSDLRNSKVTDPERQD